MTKVEPDIPQQIRELRQVLEEMEHANPRPYPEASANKGKCRMVPVKDAGKERDYAGWIAFFPGGTGCCENTFPVKGIMVLGNNFGRVQNLSGGSEYPNGPTWRPLLERLKDSDVQCKNCFFTNAYMGVMYGCHTSRGETPGCREPSYLKFCRDMFHKQVELQKPKLIIALGGYATNFLADLDKINLKHWVSRTFEARDKRWCNENNGAVVAEVSLNAHKCAVVSLVHPSMGRSNLRLRSYKGKSSREAEIEMLKDALAHSSRYGSN